MNVIAPQHPQLAPGGRGAEAADPPAFRDGSLEELPPEAGAALAKFSFPSWIGSLGFCRFYSYPPVQRIALRTNLAGEIQQAVFYNEAKWAGLFSKLEMVGPVDPGDSLSSWIGGLHRSDLLALSWQTAADFPKRLGSWRLLEVRRVTEDYRINLPATPEEYLLQLGKQTRKHLPYYLRRVQREWSERCTIQNALRDQITWESFERVVELNRLRMRTKGRQSLWTRATAERRWRLAQESGLMVSLWSGEQVAGGTLSFLQGREAYLVMIAHDPQYDRLNLGNICLWQTIEHLIALGCTVFHLLWGASFYKAQFGGQSEPIYRVTYSSNPRASAAWRLSRLLKIEEIVSLAQKIRRRLIRI